MLDYKYACIPLALDFLFPEGYIGKDRLLREFSFRYPKGMHRNSVINDLPHYAPVYVLGDGSYSSNYSQGDMFWTLLEYKTRLSYTIRHTEMVILVYNLDSDLSHAIALPGSSAHSIMNRVETHMFILPMKNTTVIPF